MESAVPIPRREVGIARTVKMCQILELCFGKKTESTQHSIDACAIPKTVNQAQVQESWRNNDRRPCDGDNSVPPVQGIWQFCSHLRHAWDEQLP